MVGCKTSLPPHKTHNMTSSTALVQADIQTQVCTYLEVEVQDDDHLPVTRLEDGVLDVVVKDVHFVAADRREAETWRREVYLLVELLMCPGAG